MNERIKELDEQAGLDPCVFYDNLLRISDFAKLVRQDERIACADLVFEMAQLPKYENVWIPLHHAQSAIRERQSK